VRDAHPRFANLTDRAGISSLDRFARVLLMLAAAAFGLLALAVSPASAAYSHATSDAPFEVSTGGDCPQIVDIAVDEGAGYVYVSCSNRIKRFTLTGSPAPFSAVKPYISGNALIGNPGATTEEFEQPKIAVDNSGLQNDGTLFVTGSPNVDLFNITGEYAGPILQPTEGASPNRFDGIDVDPAGFVYVTSGAPGARISKYDKNFNEIKRLYGSYGYEDNYGEPDFVRADSTGAVWQTHGGFGNPEALTKFEANQFTEELNIGLIFGPAQRRLLEPWKAKPSPFAPNPLISGSVNSYDVDLSDNDIYLNRGNRVETYSAGNAEETAHRNAPDFGVGKLTSSLGIAITLDNHVYASTESNKVIRFGPGDLLPDIKTPQPAIAEIGHEGATLHATVKRAGGDPVSKCIVQYGKDTTYEGAESGTAKCSPDAESVNYTANETAVSAVVTGLKAGQTYHYRFLAGNAHGDNFGIDRTFTPAFVLQVETLEPESIDDSGATLRGTLNPDGKETTYHFEYGLTTNYKNSTPELGAGMGTTLLTKIEPIADLPSGRFIHYRIVATNEKGTTYGQDEVFRVASPPEIAAVSAKELTGSTAVVQAGVNPVGYGTEYHFEYGPTINYGSSMPAEPVDIGDGVEAIKVSQKLTGLTLGVTYHFRVVAENIWGVAASDDTTFDFSPPACPNELVRQQTRASYLPDCRAYELVSPAVAGPVNIWPGNEAVELCNQEECTWAQNEGFANSPPRLAYFGGLGSMNGLDGPTSAVDMYMATRTNEGWVTTLPGLSGHEAWNTERKQCTETLDLCLDNRGDEGFIEEKAPFVFTSEGQSRGRLPTNLSEVPGAEQFRGEQRISPDGSHYIFASGKAEGFFGNVEPFVFATGGKATGIGSVYDNDIAAKTVTVISKLGNGFDIPEEVMPSTEWKAIRIGGVSTDGSHVLMQTPALGGGYHLYMHHVVTYDITLGAGTELVGMTRDGTKVVFSTAAQLTGDDNDTGTDLYLWEEEATEPGKLTRISKGGGNGDSDECVISLTGCSISIVVPERAHPEENKMISIPGQDDMLAAGTGDVYFFSPENLDPARPGIKNEPNLYLYRNGAVQYVTTFDSGTSIERLQISTDGSHAAFVTKARLTPYDNAERSMMYVYNAETGVLRCASCNPSGAAPTVGVEASQGGRFMADNGRAFFSTEESLVPQDANGSIVDTYEYVDGSPRLISSGQGSRDFTGEQGVLSFLAQPVFIGLEHVSRDGTDVFFSTFETLAPQDLNGSFVKFYDARSGGGFLVSPDLGPCAAADECHGADSNPPAAPVVGTGTYLGTGGNVQQSQRKKHKKKHRKKHRRRKAAHQRNAKHQRGHRG
jgi:hypothetical protein